MALPVSPLPTSTVTIAGVAVDIRSLSRSEVVSLSDLRDDTGAAEILMLARSTGVTDDEAKAWRESVNAETAGELLGAIGELSGLHSGKR